MVVSYRHRNVLSQSESRRWGRDSGKQGDVQDGERYRPPLCNGSCEITAARGTRAGGSDVAKQ